MTTELSIIDSDAANLSNPNHASIEAPATEPPATEPSATEPSGPGAWSDWVGMAASIGCAIHCAAMPFVIAYLPALGLSFLADEAFHQWMALACFVIALTAFVPGLRKHGRLTPVSVASVGLVMISVAAFGLAGECCPSCAAISGNAISGNAVSGNAVSDNAVADNGLAAGNAPPGQAACTDEACAFCAAKKERSSADQAGVPPSELAASTPPWLAGIAPWLTPVGGILLVSAHLLNRRYGCLCGCCESETLSEAAA